MGSGSPRLADSYGSFSPAPLGDAGPPLQILPADAPRGHPSFLVMAAAIWMLAAVAGSAQAPPAIQTVAGNGGSGFSGDNGPATSATLQAPAGIAVDGAGNLFIADSSNYRIRRVDAQTGVITTVAGNGTSSYSGDGGPATSAGVEVTGVAADSAGNLFIAGQDNRIRRVDARTHLIATLAGSGSSGYSGDGFDAASASLNRPDGVAVDSAGNVFIADTGNHRVRRVDARTRIITTLAGNGIAGYAGDSGAASGANLNSPSGVAVDAGGNLFIADAGNYRVRRVDARTGVITTVAGNGNDGFIGSQNGVPATSTGMSPVGVAVDGAGNLFIADPIFTNSRVRRVDPQTGVILLVAGNGTSSYSGDGGPATSAGLNEPQGVAVDNTGNLLIADTGNNRVRRVAFYTGPRLVLSQPSVSFTMGGSQTVTVTSSGAALGFTASASTASGGAWLSVAPAGGVTPATLTVSVDATALAAATYGGNIVLAAGTSGTTVMPVSLSSAPSLGPPIIQTVAGNGGAGFTGDNGPATSASLKSPVNVAVDGAGNLFIADSANYRIRRVDAGTGVITTVAGNGTNNYAATGDGGPATSAGLASLAAVAVDSAGNLFLAGGNRIRRVDAQTHIITTVAGSDGSGYTGDGFDAASASLNGPLDVAVDSAGNLFIADTGNHCIRRVDARTRIITTVAGNGSSGFAGDGGAATNSNLNRPSGVAVDTGGNLFIADAGNYRVRRVDGRTGVIATVAGNGDDGFIGGQNGVPATSTGMSPVSVAVDAAENLYFADPVFTNSRVRRVDPQTGVVLLVAGNGTDGYSGDGGPATSASLDSPQGVAVDNAGNLLIADTGNNRIRQVVFSTGPRLVLSPPALSFTTGGSQTVSVTSSAAALSFAAVASTTSGGNWLSVSPSTATTPASLSIAAGALPAPGSYSGTVTISAPGADNSPQTIAVSLTVTVVCAYGLTASSASFAAQASNGSVGVAASAGSCGWSASSPVSWIVITAGAGGTGNGTVSYNVVANTSSSARSATLTIAGQPYTVAQAGQGCQIGLTPASASFGLGNGTDSFGVSLGGADCAWRTSSNALWATITSAGTMGSGRVSYSVAGNSSQFSRNGSITVSTSDAQAIFTITQAGNAPCTYTLPRASQAFPSSGGSGAATVATAAGCPWSADSSAVPWVTVTGGSSGSGNGTVGYTVSANTTGADRTGALNIAGQPYTVSQAAGAGASCTASVATPPPVALEGRTEVPGDLVVNCVGVTGPVNADIALTLNTNITNLLTGGTTTDALLANGNNTPQNGQVSGYNTIRWPGVTLQPGTASLRITNVRADASLLGTAGSLQALPITGQVSVNIGTAVPVAYAAQAGTCGSAATSETMACAAPTLAFHRGAATPPAGGGQTVIPLVYQEATTGAFRAGAAATRLRMALSNVPGAVQVYVPVYPAEGNSLAQLYSADATGAGGSPVAGSPFAGGAYQLLTGSSITATWVVLSADAARLEALTFPLLVTNAANSDLTSMQIVASLGPVSSVSVASASAPIPRYRDFSVPQNLVNLRVSIVTAPSSSSSAAGSSHAIPRAVGSNLVSTITVVNDTSDPSQTATGVRVNSSVSGANIISCTVSASTCNFTGTGAQVAFGTLGPGERRTMTLTEQGATLSPGGTIDSTAQASADQVTADLAAATASSSYLLVGGVPVAVSIQPPSGSAGSRSFTLQFSYPTGYQNLSVVNVLINSFLDGRNACYLAYEVQASKLDLVNDAGQSAGPYASVVLGDAGAIQNSQCAVNLVSAVGSGTTLTLTLNIAFKPAFAGNKIAYVAARDQGQGNSNWQALGVWQVPGSPQTGTIAVTGLTPARGTKPAGTSQQFTLTLTDTQGTSDFGVVNLLINNFIDGRQGCYLAYVAPGNTLLLVDDAGDAGGSYAGSLPLNGGSGEIENSQCAVSAAGSTAVPSVNTLTLTLNITFKGAFTGNRVLYAAGRDRSEGNSTGWQALGSWAVQ